MQKKLAKCAKCDQRPVIARNPEAFAVEIHCACGRGFRWAPIENGDTAERPIDDLEAEAISLWNLAQTGVRAGV